MKGSDKKALAETPIVSPLFFDEPKRLFSEVSRCVQFFLMSSCSNTCVFLERVN